MTPGVDCSFLDVPAEPEWKVGTAFSSPFFGGSTTTVWSTPWKPSIRCPACGWWQEPIAAGSAVQCVGERDARQTTSARWSPTRCKVYFRTDDSKWLFAALVVRNRTVSLPPVYCPPIPPMVIPPIPPLYIPQIPPLYIPQIPPLPF